MSAGIPKRSRVWVASIMAISALFLVVMALSSETLGCGDAFLHYLICQRAWSHPELLMDVWGRPSFTLVYMIPSLGGIEAVRLWSVLVSLLTCFVTYRIAKDDGDERALLVMPLLLLQPLYLQASFDGLTEILFACMIAVAVWKYNRKQWVASAAVASLLSMTRWEGCLLILVWAWFLWPRNRLLAVLVFLPHLLWNGLTAVFFRDWPQLLFPFDMVLRDMTFTPKTYAVSELLFFPRNWLSTVGPALLVLTQIGLVTHARRRRLEAVTLLAMTVFYILASWGMPGVRGAAVPLARYFVGLGPMIALAGLRGFNELARVNRGSRWLPLVLALVTSEVLLVAAFSSHPLELRFLQLYAVAGGLGFAALILIRISDRPDLGRQRLVFIRLVLVGVLVSTGALAARKVRPHRAGPFEAQVRDAAAWLRRTEPDGGTVLVSEPYSAYYVSTAASAGTPFHYEWMNPERVEALPGGGWVMWEMSLSSIMFFEVTMSDMDSNPTFSLRERFGPAGSAIRLYQRIGRAGPANTDFETLIHRYWPDDTGSGQSHRPQ